MSENKKNSFADKFKKSNQGSAGSMASKFAGRSSQPEKSSMSEKYKKKEAQTTAQSVSNKKKVDPKKAEKADLIYLVKGIDDGRNAWYYVLVERLKLSLFLKALNDDIIHLEEYGKILYSAYGDDPPQEITDKLKEEYGID